MLERVSSRGTSWGNPTGPTAPVQPHSIGRKRCARVVTAGASQRFAAATEVLDCGTPVVSVIGEVDRVTATALEQTLLGVTEDLTGEVIVDLTGCSFLDSRGLNALVETRARLERLDRPLVLVLSNPNVWRIFQITECDALFEIYPSLGAALDGSRKQS